jgi:SHS2 domain-containing protein
MFNGIDLDHTADIQFHSCNLVCPPFLLSPYICHDGDTPIGGSTLEEAFEGQVMAMFGYITELDTVEIDHAQDLEFGIPDGMSTILHHLFVILRLVDERASL